MFTINQEYVDLLVLIPFKQGRYSNGKLAKYTDTGTRS